jgi:CDP-2,3-bis-(O-geranylgeranyl)-sn-glycerol synthase
MISHLMSLILQSLYFFLPAYFANMAPVFLRKKGRVISESLFGKNKTWSGILAGTLVGGLVFWIQKYVYLSGWEKLALIDYSDFSVAFGFLLGLGALLGDVVASYYKRKKKIRPGKMWFPWDQLDFVFGGILLGGVIYFPPIETVVVLLVGSPLLHLGVNYLGYLLKIKENKF